MLKNGSERVLRLSKNLSLMKCLVWMRRRRRGAADVHQVYHLTRKTMPITYKAGPKTRSEHTLKFEENSDERETLGSFRGQTKVHRYNEMRAYLCAMQRQASRSWQSRYTLAQLRVPGRKRARASREHAVGTRREVHPGAQGQGGIRSSRGRNPN